MREIRAAFTAVVLAANDPVAAWGGVRMLREQFGIEPVAVTGPATDNVAGTRIIEEVVGVPAINARTDGERLAALVRERLGIGVPCRGGGGMNAPVPAVVLGGTGYVAGELLRLLAGHPSLRLAAVLSDSQSGGAVESAFPHLAGCYPGLAFSGREDLARLVG